VSHPGRTLGDMSTERRPQHLARPEQLSLLPASELPQQFLLDDRTRRRGLQQVAALRRQLEQRAAARSQQVVALAPEPAPQRRRAA
jgi:hypothetical protein